MPLYLFPETSFYFIESVPMTCFYNLLINSLIAYILMPGLQPSQYDI